MLRYLKYMHDRWRKQLEAVANARFQTQPASREDVCRRIDAPSSGLAQVTRSRVEGDDEARRAFPYPRR
jgi:hypothetical protein